MRFQPQFKVFTFAGLLVDVEKREIQDSQRQTRRLVGKPFDVLVFLAANHNRFVSIQELLDEFWANDDESGDLDKYDPQNVYKAVSKIRLGLGDASSVITERRRGVRLKGPVAFPAVQELSRGLAESETAIPEKQAETLGWAGHLLKDESDSIANTVPSAASAISRRVWLRYGLGAVSAIAAGAVLGHRFRRHNPPSAFRVEGVSLIVLGSDGTELWRHSFPRQLDETAYTNCNTECDQCQFADIDGDGRLETLFRQHVQSGDRRLICFDFKGRVLWDFVPSRTVIDNLGRSFAPPFWPNRFGVFGSKRQQNKRIVVSSNHNWSFPDQVAVLEAKTGQVLSEYWHRGHLLHMASADLDGDGEPEILLGGVNDAPEYKQATVVIFDHRNISGASKNPKGGVYFQGMSPGSEKKVIFFPRTPISKNLEFNRVSVVRVEPERIRVNVVENTEEEGPYAVYEFDYQLRPINVALSNALMDRYRELQASGQLPKESFDKITQRLRAEIIIL